MAAMAGLINQSLQTGRSMTAGQALNGKDADPMAAAPAAAGNAASSGSSGSSSATISANDFLTLLVTEMQNQDPTAQTDPNEYINQLVQVNSLEQLIDINQNLTTALGTSNTSTASVATADGSAVNSADSAGSPATQPTGTTAALIASPGMPASGTPASTPPGSNVRSAMSQIAHSATEQYAPGNLSAPVADPAATRVGHALDGHAQRTVLHGKLPPAH